MKNVYIIAIWALVTLSCSPNKKRDDHAKMDKFVNELMRRMTLEEKIGQLNLTSAGDVVTGQAQNSDIAGKIKKGEVGALLNIQGVDKIREIQKIAVEESRMRIPLLIGLDVIHGYKTIFPIPLGLSSTWNMEAIERSAQIAAKEAAADGFNWTFSPMVDISRDPRWGRVSEGSGEDPFLGSAIARAMVRGYQGDHSFSSDSTILACVKHFALYGASEAGRDYNTVDMSRIRMFNEYMAPYQAAIDEGAGSVMASFNEIDGIPATANKWLLTNVLRDQWKFGGFVVADYTGISEMIDHGIGNQQEVSIKALNAGLDMDMVSESYLKTLKKSFKEGKLDLKQIDIACRRILEAKYKLGLFEDPYKYCKTDRSKSLIYTPENRAIARKIAAESFVLLKNENNTLPICKGGRIAVVGPLGNNRANMVGTWSVSADFTQPLTLVEGLQAVAGKQATVVYAKGSNLTSDPELEERGTMFGRELGRDNRSEEALRSEAIQLARTSDVIIAALGEASEMSGESSSRTDLSIPDVQQRLLKELLKTGKPVVLVLFTGRPLTITWENENVPAILNVWFGGSEAAYAIADVLYGDVNPSGKLTMTFPRNVGQIPIYYNHKNTGRPLQEGRWFEKFRSNYLDVENEPLYPFGYGLSYTSFEYSEIALSSKSFKAGGKITASVMVTNSGHRDGAEVVQLYLRDVVGNITRPVKELKGFKKIFLKAGETKTVQFQIDEDLLKFYTPELKYIAEPGEFTVMIGGNSRDLKTARFTLE